MIARRRDRRVVADRDEVLVALRRVEPPFVGRQEHLDPHPGAIRATPSSAPRRARASVNSAARMCCLMRSRSRSCGLAAMTSLPLAQRTTRGEALPVVPRQHRAPRPATGSARWGASRTPFTRAARSWFRVGEQDLALVGEVAEERAVGDRARRAISTTLVFSNPCSRNNCSAAAVRRSSLPCSHRGTGSTLQGDDTARHQDYLDVTTRHHWAQSSTGSDFVAPQERLPAPPVKQKPVAGPEMPEDGQGVEAAPVATGEQTAPAPPLEEAQQDQVTQVKKIPAEQKSAPSAPAVKKSKKLKKEVPARIVQRVEPKPRLS